MNLKITQIAGAHKKGKRKKNEKLSSHKARQHLVRQAGAGGGTKLSS